MVHFDHPATFFSIVALDDLTPWHRPDRLVIAPLPPPKPPRRHTLATRLAPTTGPG